MFYLFIWVSYSSYLVFSPKALNQVLNSSPVQWVLFYFPENALKKLLFYSGIDHIAMHYTGLHPISVFNFTLTETCVASYSSSTCIVCLAGSQIASTCFKEAAPSTEYSNRNEYNSSSLIWLSTGHNFIIIVLFTLKKILRDLGVTALTDLHGKYSWPS